MSPLLHVALIQLDAQQDLPSNLHKALAFCRQAILEGAQFIALPEMFNYRGPHYVGETIPGPSTQPFIDLAAQHHVWILAGSICEISPVSDRFYNSSALIGPKGVLAVYRKLHLFDAVVDERSIQESRSFTPGATPIMAAVRDIPIGLSICYDLRFPSLYTHYAKSGVELIAVPASFTATTGAAHWEVLLRARAIETQCFVLAPNQVGLGARNVKTFGNSMIVDPWGQLLAQGNDSDEGLISATLDLAHLHEIRAKLPTHLHRREL